MRCFLFMCVFVAQCSWASEFTMHQNSQDRIDFSIRNVKAELLTHQKVFIPPQIFQVWHSLQRTLPFEVGGGVDFNLLKEVERLKLTVGKDQQVSFLPDFEVAWHTHPQLKPQGFLKEFNPPSPSDIQLAIISNYNLWLLGKQVNDPEQYFIKVRRFSENLERPLAVEINLVLDKTGIYIYYAEQQYWSRIWKKGLKATQKAIVQLKPQLQASVERFQQQYSSQQDLEQFRQRYLEEIRDNAHVQLDFVPWQTVLTDGVELSINLIELLRSHRFKGNTS